MTTNKTEEQLSVLIYYAVANKQDKISIPLSLAVELDNIAQTLARIEKEIERKDR